MENTAPFDFELPAALIAQQPLPERSASRLLVSYRDGALTDRCMRELPGLLRPGDLVVVNDSRVLNARLAGRKESGASVELLLERIEAPDQALVQMRANRPARPGARILFADGSSAEVVGRELPFFRLRFSAPVLSLLERLGQVPLPPYIRRPDASSDRERYQTVYAREPGSVAAPTAGLHFDAPLLAALEQAGVGLGRLTLHVGAGTFRPVQPEQVASRRLHAEYLQVDEALCARVAATRAAGGRVVAVGTTVVRGLETAARGGELAPYAGETSLFLMPGDRFRVTSLLLTNFHLPGSSLLWLVAAFAGTARIAAAYQHAIDQAYRFFSYGDAMLLERADEAGA
ncbi:MAG: tRNA preQ1(34) S-adenosylmethionine ribosyltransferase-isomerase QueA [Chromatiales bacterium]|nr:tRNA preQ1(34) S-adenosylmethionine ribosyltransferase-isomerase QueA [Chromatiales bacterium]